MKKRVKATKQAELSIVGNEVAKAIAELSSWTSADHANLVYDDTGLFLQGIGPETTMRVNLQKGTATAPLKFTFNLFSLQGITKNRGNMKLTVDTKDSSQLHFSAGSYSGHIQVIPYNHLEFPVPEGTKLEFQTTDTGELFRIYDTVAINNILGNEPLAFMLRVKDGTAVAAVIDTTHTASTQQATTLPNLELIVPCAMLNSLRKLMRNYDSTLWLNANNVFLKNQELSIRIPTLQPQVYIDLDTFFGRVNALPEHNKTDSVKVEPALIQGMMTNAGAIMEQDTPITLTRDKDQMVLSATGKFGHVTESIETDKKSIWGKWETPYKVTPAFMGELLRFANGEVNICFSQGLMYFRENGNLYSCATH